jgi:hypothetical protein
VTGKLLEPKLYQQAPSVCTKPGCGGTVFIPHEDGWQCFNCMKIIYKVSTEPPQNSVPRRYARDEKKPEPLINKIRKPEPKPSRSFGYVDE